MGMMIFLTDGQPTSGERNGNNIRRNVKDQNTNKIPIFGLAFGRDSDFSLMKEISREADSFAKQIYEGSDAAIQLEDFFSQISNPLISELKFEYVGEVVDNSSLSKANFNSFFMGGEYVVVGKLNNMLNFGEDKFTIILLGDKYDGKYEKKIDICLRPQALPVNYGQQDHFSHHCISQPKYPARSAEQNFMQKLHAFVNIKQLLKRDETKLSNGESPKNKALRLSLENNFVTELTSLVVVAGQEVKIASLKNSVSSGYSPISHGISRSYGGISAQSFGHSGGISAQSFDPYGLSAQSALSYGGISAQSAMVPSFALGHGNSGRGGYGRRGQSRGSSSGSRHKSKQMGKSYMYKQKGNSNIYNLSKTSLLSVCSGSISLFSKTYNRGTNLTISSDTPDLEHLQFTDQLVSLSVSGDCCWEVFTGTNYNGDSKQFTSSGTFVSTTSVGPVFRNAKSVKRC
eukprot:TRINITY_DN3099_c0_g1_i1.p1 TRINITY_DN3099_c0_g1~~TRINITY_DN3099_c0_g1_i1.p1  ORF type:complete len:474 (-),score=125.88 TRINITY_DN3099_c0_g1_i1:145-1518(-)